MDRNHFTLAMLIYIALFTLIGFVCYITKSAIPLVGLLLMPNVKSR